MKTEPCYFSIVFHRTIFKRLITLRNFEMHLFILDKDVILKKMIERKEILNQLQNLKPFLKKKYGLTELALFGSSSREENKAGSDIDLLVDLSKNTSSDFFNIAFQLKDLFYPIKVDIVTKKGLKPAYFKSIQKDLIYV